MTDDGDPAIETKGVSNKTSGSKGILGIATNTTQEAIDRGEPQAKPSETILPRAKAAVLSEIGTKQTAPPKEVVFETTQEPIVDLKYGEPIRIRFYDDTGRENFRQGFAEHLAKKSTWLRERR